MASLDLLRSVAPMELEKASDDFGCRMCDVACNTAEMLALHQAGKKHVRKASLAFQTTVKEANLALRIGNAR